jgi:hypothetical protein
MKERKSNEEGEKLSPVARVIIVRTDGAVEYLKDDDARLWEKTINGLVVLGYSHGGQGQKELGLLKWNAAKSLADMVRSDKSSKK